MASPDTPRIDIPPIEIPPLDLGRFQPGNSPADFARVGLGLPGVGQNPGRAPALKPSDMRAAGVPVTTDPSTPESLPSTALAPPQTNGKPPKWGQVMAHPGAKDLSPQEFDQLRKGYFANVVAPQLDPDDLPAAWSAFQQRTAPTQTAPAALPNAATASPPAAIVKAAPSVAPPDATAISAPIDAQDHPMPSGKAIETGTASMFSPAEAQRNLDQDYSPQGFAELNAAIAKAPNAYERRDLQQEKERRLKVLADSPAAVAAPKPQPAPTAAAVQSPVPPGDPIQDQVIGADQTPAKTAGPVIEAPTVDVVGHYVPPSPEEQAQMDAEDRANGVPGLPPLTAEQGFRERSMQLRAAQDLKDTEDLVNAYADQNNVSHDIARSEIAGIQAQARRRLDEGEDPVAVHNWASERYATPMGGLRASSGRSFNDYLLGLANGVNTLLATPAGLANAATLGGYDGLIKAIAGKSATQMASDIDAYLSGQMSDQTLSEKYNLTGKKGAIDVATTLLRNPKLLVQVGGESAPSTLGLMGITRFAVLKAYSTAERLALEAGRSGTTAASIAREAATNAGEKATVIANGLIGGGQTALQTKQQVMAMSEPDLEKSPIYSWLRKYVSADTAKEVTANLAAEPAAFIAGIGDALATKVSGAGKSEAQILGGKSIAAKIENFRRLPTPEAMAGVFRPMVNEMKEEFLQSGPAEQGGQNVGMKVANPDQSLTDQVMEQGAMGATLAAAQTLLLHGAGAIVKPLGTLNSQTKPIDRTVEPHIGSMPLNPTGPEANVASMPRVASAEPPLKTFPEIESANEPSLGTETSDVAEYQRNKLNIKLPTTSTPVGEIAGQPEQVAGRMGALATAGRLSQETGQPHEAVPDSNDPSKWLVRPVNGPAPSPRGEVPEDLAGALTDLQTRYKEAQSRGEPTSPILHEVVGTLATWYENATRQQREDVAARDDALGKAINHLTIPTAEGKPAQSAAEMPSTEQAPRVTVGEPLAAPEYRSELETMAKNAGWQETGGRMMRDEEGNVTGRTSWIPREDWWPNRPDKLNPAQVQEAVRKALAGEPLKAAEKRTIDYMLESAQQRIEAGKSLSEAELPVNEQNVVDHGLVKRAASIDEGAVERLSIQYPNDDAAFMMGIRGIIHGNESSKVGAGSEINAGPRARSESAIASAATPGATAAAPNLPPPQGGQEVKIYGSRLPALGQAAQITKRTGQQHEAVPHPTEVDKWMVRAVGPESAASIDAAAHEASTSPLNNLAEPTEEQKSAGNYKMGHVRLHGLDITIENPRSSVRSGVDANGKPWETTMAHHYGYIRNTEDKTGEHIDTFIGPNPASENVFVVDQRKPGNGHFDEFKVLLGFDTLAQAKKGYADSYTRGWDGLKDITALSLPQFKDWLKTGDHTKPIGDQMGGSAQALAAAGVGRRPYSPATATTTPNADLARPDAIREAIRKMFNVPINEKGITMRRAAGIYKVKPQTIRVRNQNDIDVIAHETGHHFSETNQDVRTLMATHAGELLGITPSAYAQETKAVRIEEGFAEFVRLYVTQRPEAKRLAPQFAKEFDQFIDGRPPYRAIFDQLHHMIEDWFSLDPASRILAKVGARPQSITERLGRVFSKDRLIFEALDNWRPLKLMVRDLAPDIAASKDPFKAAHLLSGDAAVIEDWMVHGTIPYDYNKRADPDTYGTPLHEILKPVAKELKEFSAYLIARRAAELSARKKENLLTADEIKAGLSLGTPAFKAAAEKIYAYNNQLLDYAVEGGLLSKDVADKFREYTAYIPFFREREDDNSAGAATRNPFKRLHGGTSNLKDPISNIIQNTANIVHATNRNAVLVKAYEIAKAVPGGGRWIEEIPLPKKAMELSTERILEELRRQGVQVDTTMAQDLATMQTFWQRNPVGDEKSRTIIAKVNGEPKALQINDKMLWQALQAFEPVDLGLLGKMLAIPSDLLRAGVTLSPEFMARNFMRDTLTGFIQSKHGMKPIVGTIGGFKEVWTRSDTAKLYRAFGGAYGDLWKGESSETRKILERMAKRGKFDPRTILTPGGIISVLHRLGSVSEAGTRIAEFKKTAKLNEPATKLHRAAKRFDVDSLIDAAYDGREVSVDFGMHGHNNTIRLLTRITPFMNPALQGWYKAARTGREQFFRTLLRGSAITAFSLALYSLNRGKDWYDELEQWEKNVYWHIDVGLRDKGGNVIPLRIPKPFEWGAVFGSIPEGLAQVAIDHNGMAFAKRLGSIWNDVFAIRAVPTAILVPAEIWANKNTFTDRPIVPESVKNLDPAMQHGPYTSLTARKAGELTGTSPAQIDHLVRGFLGTMGVYGTMLADQGVRAMGDYPALPDSTWRQMPVVKAFVHDPDTPNSRYLNEFYNLLDKARRADATYKHQDGEAADAYFEKNRDAIDVTGDTNRLARDLAKLRKENREIQESRDYTGSEKLRLISENNRLSKAIAKEFMVEHPQ